EEGLSPAIFQSLTLAYPLGSSAGAMALNARWQEVLGISLRPVPLEQATLAQQILQTTGHTGPLHIWLSSWLPTYLDPASMTVSLFGRGQPFNAVNYGQNTSSTAATQQQVQNQMLWADSIRWSPTGTSIYTQIERQLVNDVAWLPLDQQQAYHLVKKGIHGPAFDPRDLIPPDNWAGGCLSTNC
ncbi:MAG: hypothetical protein M3Z08_14330, partial [Chloroflexota bacterium]|nr:hypothetical protein [Chloroflexota bacterium]